MSASVHEISNLIDPVAVAAHSEASQLGHKVSRAASRTGGGEGGTWPALTRSAPQVSQMASYFEPLVMAAIGTVSKILSSQQQMAVLDQTKTLTESALQMLYTAKEAGGNPKVLLQKLAQLAPAASSTRVAPVCVLGAGGAHAGGPGGVGADDEGGRGRPGRHASRGR